MNKVLVAGATGYLGKHIMKNLVDREINTIALIRTTSNFSQLDLPVNVIRAEVTDASTLKNCCDEIERLDSVTMGLKVLGASRIKASSNFKLSMTDTKLIFSTNGTTKRSGKVTSLPAKETYRTKTSVKQTPNNTPKVLKVNLINQTIVYLVSLSDTNLKYWLSSFNFFIIYFS